MRVFFVIKSTFFYSLNSLLSLKHVINFSLRLIDFHCKLRSAQRIVIERHIYL